MEYLFEHMFTRIFSCFFWISGILHFLLPILSKRQNLIDEKKRPDDRSLWFDRMNTLT